MRLARFHVKFGHGSHDEEHPELKRHHFQNCVNCDSPSVSGCRGTSLRWVSAVG